MDTTVSREMEVVSFCGEDLELRRWNRDRVGDVVVVDDDLKKVDLSLLLDFNLVMSPIIVNCKLCLVWSAVTSETAE